MIRSSTDRSLRSSPLVVGARYRADIEGLRAVAVIAVLLFHAEVPGFQGGYVGVDVFFVISGFLITSLLLKEIQKTGRVQLGRFYLRRARRLLPASATALVFTAIVTNLFVPMTRWIETGGDIVASALYVVNWRLAFRAVDYLAEGEALSPLQHFWSLSVEEQFYFVWPAFLILALATLRSRMSSRAALTWAMGAVIIGSLLWSIHRTGTLPGWSYFETTTRVWELAIGGALAITTPLLSPLGTRLAVLFGSVGLGLIGLSVFLYSTETVFPSYTAALPVAGSALVLAAGVREGRTIVGRALSVAPLVWIGGLSYSLYLFHWPIIVAAKANTSFNVWIGLVAVALSFIPAALSHRYVESPVRHMDALIVPKKRGLVFVAALTGAGVCVGLILALPVRLAIASPDPGEPDGLEVAGATLVYDDVPEGIPPDLHPSLLTAGDDKPDVYDRGCHISRADVEPVGCAYGDPSGRTVLLSGDSKAAQWVPAFVEIAEQRGWNLQVFTKSGCPLEAVGMNWGPKRYVECDQWRDNMADVIADLDPDVIVLSSLDQYTLVDDTGSTLGEPLRSDTVVREIADLLQRLTLDGYRVAYIADTPTPVGHIPDCLAAAGSIADCTATHAAALAVQLHQPGVDGADDAMLVDLTDALCTSSICPPIIGTTLVYRDEGHLTSTMVLALVGEITRQLESDGWLEESLR